MEPEKYLASLNWSTIDWIKSVTNLPLIFKGVVDRTTLDLLYSPPQIRLYGHLLCNTYQYLDSLAGNALLQM
uniref:Uncharacterized protein n=1 Tax=Romanomermis culicivorax TaxID=13658 RepID=A0A915KUI5_ROMCU